MTSIRSAVWRKSSYSGNAEYTNCVEIAWRTSSHSGNQGACAEAVPLLSGTVVGVRDSKDVTRGHLSIAPSSWSFFTTAIEATDT